MNTSPEGHEPIRGHIGLQKRNLSPETSFSSTAHCSLIPSPENNRLLEKFQILTRTRQETHERPPIGITPKFIHLIMFCSIGSQISNIENTIQSIKILPK